MIELTKRISFELQLPYEIQDLLFNNQLFVSDSYIDRKGQRSIATSDHSEAVPKLSSNNNLTAQRQIQSSVMSWFEERGIEPGHPDEMFQEVTQEHRHQLAGLKAKMGRTTSGTLVQKGKRPNLFVSV